MAPVLAHVVVPAVVPVVMTPAVFSCGVCFVDPLGCSCGDLMALVEVHVLVL